ncbi:MAG: 3-isopropylmalate dehydratase small subunit [Anaerolineaceae bacterium]|nr:3-isopropylmalate dehydratase small subunit [Anaerolineaceae bacterium]
MKKFTALTSRLVPLPVNDIDTDQIIPARFLKVIDKQGLGQNLFADWRYETDGTPKPDFPLNRPENQGAQILLAANNFGCGSSREHAPWALTSFGFHAILATSFADIFYNNALKNGLLPVVLDPATHQALLDARMQDADLEITIDLVNQTVTLPDNQQASFTVDNFARACLMQGTDQLGYLLSFTDKIAQYEQQQELAPAAGE